VVGPTRPLLSVVVSQITAPVKVVPFQYCPLLGPLVDQMVSWVF